ncbi:MAG TPA: shikimate dehydrogenase [Ktedonobacterales bacterium]
MPPSHEDASEAEAQLSGVARLGLIGHPIAHSRSPAMQQAAFDALDLPARYEQWDTPDEMALAERVAALRQPAMLGANVTIPWKEAVAPLLDDLDDSARRIAGAVNTIIRAEMEQGVRLTGHNTDAPALDRTLDDLGAWSDARRMLVLGAGGAAQAALGVAHMRGVEPWLVARRIETAWEAMAKLATRLPVPERWRDHVVALDDPGALRAALTESQILINATPVGVGDIEASPLPLDLLAALPSDAAVLDLIYAPPETALVRAARARGLRAEGGLPMLLYQGALAFTLWTGQPAPLDVMRRALAIE